MTALVSDPCDATGNTVYAGAADGGVWVSFNALSGNPVTWTPLTDQEPSVAVGAIALIPGSCPTFGGHAQSSEIVVGTGESNFAQDNMYGAGVLRSVNGGQIWKQDQTFTQGASQGPGASGPYIGGIAAQPNVAHPVLLAAVQGTDYAAGGTLHSGVWRSTDEGATWTRSQPGATSASGAPFNLLRTCCSIRAILRARQCTRRLAIRAVMRTLRPRARVRRATDCTFLRMPESLGTASRRSIRWRPRHHMDAFRWRHRRALRQGVQSCGCRSRTQRRVRTIY